MKYERHNGSFNCAACNSGITGWLKRLGHSSRSLLSFSIDQGRLYMPFELVPHGYYALSNDLPWDKIDAPEAPPQDAMVFSALDTDNLTIDPENNLDQRYGGLRGIYGPNMSCDCGRRIATCVSDPFSVHYVYVPLSNLRYRRHTTRVDNLWPRAQADIRFSGEDAGFRILIVDGNAGRRTERREFLERFGYEVIEAEGGREGVASAIREEPVLVLINDVLADMKGLEAAKLISDQSLPQSITLMGPETDDGEIRSEAYRAGCSAYLEQPCFKLELLELVKRLLRAHQSDEA